jgi:flagellar biosynthesis protein FlhF
MSIKRFVAPSGRETLAQVRRELGADALVLATRRLTGGRVEMLAVAPDDMQSLIEEGRRPGGAPAAAEATPASRSPAAARVHAPASGLRTESFESFVLRQSAAAASSDVSASASAPRSGARPAAAPASAEAATDTAAAPAAPSVFRRRGGEMPATPAPVAGASMTSAAGWVASADEPMSRAVTSMATAAPSKAAPAGTVAAAAGAAAVVPMNAAAGPMASPAALMTPTDGPITAAAPITSAAGSLPNAKAPIAAAGAQGVPAAAPAALAAGPRVSAMAPLASGPATAVAPPPVLAAAPGADARLLAELQQMRALLLEQMAAMGAANSAAELHRRSPMQVRAMTRLLTAGFSPEVARHVAERSPAAASPADSDRWLADLLALNLRCADGDSDWLRRGGVYALVGPTGVGKTTTVAKLAARFALQQGASALGLITLDAFRIGAREQLAMYGRILGAPVHLAQDAATLRELLASMAGKQLVLIDTCGVSQRDERLGEMLSMLEQAGSDQRPIERLLLLNAASHAETLDDVARAWSGRQCAGVLLTKLDEAVRIGGALDCMLRHKLAAFGATNGQRVPEDWLAIDSRQLAAAALRPGQGPFRLAEAEAAVLGATFRPANLVAQ